MAKTIIGFVVGLIAVGLIFAELESGNPSGRKVFNYDTWPSQRETYR